VNPAADHLNRSCARVALSVAAMVAVSVALLGVALFETPAGASKHHAKKAKTSSSCAAYKAGKNGVIRTFCTGPATATVTAGGTTTVMKGGTCANSGGFYAINVGVVTGPGFKGAKPNYFGLDAPTNATTFSNATLAYAVSGTGGYATTNSGTVAANHKSGTFSGTDLEGKTVSGSFTC
jgi:hypothetical protein